MAKSTRFPIVRSLARELNVESCRYRRQSRCRRTRNWMRFAGSINFDNGVRSTRNVIVSYAVKLSPGAKFRSLAERAAMARYDSVAQQNAATRFQWIGCCRRMRLWRRCRWMARSNANLCCRILLLKRMLPRRWRTQSVTALHREYAIWRYT